MTRAADRERLSVLQRRLQVPLPWAATILAAVTVGVFAAAWLNGQPPWMVAFATLAAALLTLAALTASGPVFETRAFRVVAHLILGTLVLLVAFLMTALGAAEGALTASLVNVVVLVSVWGLGLALVLAGLLVLVGARRPLRAVASLGLVVTGIWGIIVLLVLGSLVVRVLLEGIDVSLAQDLRDDLIPFLALFVSFVVFPALVFLGDLRDSRGRDPSED